MKNKKLILSLLIIFSLKINAQIAYGIKGGINYSDIKFITSFEPETPTDYKLDFHIGGFLTKKITEKLFFKPEILFSRKGYKGQSTYYVNGESVTNNFKINLEYINLPLFIEYKVLNKIKFETGVELGYLINAYSKFDTDKNDISNIWDNKFDMGIGLGIVYELNKNFSMNIRFTNGLISIFKEDELYISETNTTGKYAPINRNLQISLNYNIR